MTDLIDRQAAIDALDKILPAWKQNDSMKNDFTRGIMVGAALAVERIVRVPSATIETAEDSSAENASSWEYIEPKQVLQRTVIGGLALLLRYRCKNCGYLSFSESKYCPECGRRMGEEDDSRRSD